MKFGNKGMANLAKNGEFGSYLGKEWGIVFRDDSNENIFVGFGMNTDPGVITLYQG
jgi:hypothetical protein